MRFGRTMQMIIGGMTSDQLKAIYDRYDPRGRELNETEILRIYEQEKLGNVRCEDCRGSGTVFKMLVCARCSGEGFHLAGDNGGYELGKSYFCHYWQEGHTVMKIHDNFMGGWGVTVLWHNDGRQTSHCTTRGSRDHEIPTPADIKERLNRDLLELQENG